MTLTKLLNRLVRDAPDVINGMAKPHQPHCVLATAVGQMVLARFGVTAEPHPVEIAVCNQAWMDWMKEGHPGGIEEQQRRGAYILTNHPNWKGASFQSRPVDNPWSGHLVLRVPSKGNGQWLVDLDLGSFARPQHNVRVPGGLVGPLNPDGTLYATYTDEAVVTTVDYRPLVAPYRDDYQTARDWTERERWADDVKDLERAMRG